MSRMRMPSARLKRRRSSKDATLAAVTNQSHQAAEADTGLPLPASASAADSATRSPNGIADRTKSMPYTRRSGIRPLAISGWSDSTEFGSATMPGMTVLSSRDYSCRRLDAIPTARTDRSRRNPTILYRFITMLAA